MRPNFGKFGWHIKSGEAIEEVSPDAKALGFVEIAIMESELNPGFEGFVEGADAVTGED